MRKKILLLIGFIMIVYNCIGQEKKEECGPPGLENERTNILGQELSKQPYSAIVHIAVHRIYNFCGGGGVGTASFINDSVLITANHVLIRSPFITRSTLYFKKDSIKLKRKDFKIYHYHQSLFHSNSKDIAIVVLSEEIKNKVRQIQKSSFEISPYEDLIDANKIVHLTGFPSDRPNILVEKFCQKNDLFNNDSNPSIVAYKKLYTCTGDSGAPLWYDDNGVFKVIGIHHGWTEGTGNWGIKITDDVINWINQKTNNLKNLKL